jgi:phage terminase Nu1 subunit (DNA packaging protein)
MRETGQAKVQKARARLLAAQAELREQEHKVKSGQLHDARACYVKLFTQGRQLRDMVLSVPDRIAPLLVGQSQAKIHALLRDELTDIFRKFSEKGDTAHEEKKDG